MNANSNQTVLGSNHLGERTVIAESQVGLHSDPITRDPRETNLPPELERSISQLAETAGNLEPDVVALTIATVEKRRQGERAHNKSRRESLNSRLATEQQWHAEAANRLSREEPTLAGKSRIIEWASPKNLLLLIAFAGVLLLENTCAAIVVRNVAAFGITSMWVARGICATPIGPALVLAIAIRLVSISLRQKIYIGAIGLLILASALWATGFAVEVSRSSRESGAGFADAVQKSFVAPAPEWPALTMFTASIVMLGTSTFLGHAAFEILFNSSGDRKENPHYNKAMSDMRETEAKIAAIKNEITVLDRNLAADDAEQSYAVNAATAYYKYLRRNMAALAIFVSVTLSATGCGNDTSREADQGTASGAQLAVAVSPELDEAARSIASQELARLADWASEAVPGSTVVVIDGQRGNVIARLVAVEGVQRLRKKALLEPMRQVLAFLDKGSQRTKNPSLGCVNVPRICQTISQLDEKPSRVCILGNPLFDSDAENDKPFSMLGGKVPSDRHPFHAMSPFSVLNREDVLSAQDWFFGCEGKSVFTGELHRHRVDRFWSHYLTAQGASLVFSGSSFSGAVDAMLRAKSPRRLMYDEPDRTAPLEMVAIQATPAERLEEQTVDIVKRQTSFKQVVDAPELSVEAQHINLSEVTPNKTFQQRNILILAFSNDPEIRASPLPQTLRNEGFRVASLNYPLPTFERFDSILERAHEVWVVSSARADQLPDAHMRSLVSRWRAGKIGLALFADNAPHFQESNSLIAAICPGAILGGNDPGGKTLYTRVDSGLAGYAPHSPLFEGIGNGGLWEGTTISSVDCTNCSGSPRPEPVCWSSAGKPLIATVEAGGSRCMVHCGFTALYSRFFTAGTSQFVVNAAHWLDPVNAKVSLVSTGNATAESQGK